MGKPPERPPPPEALMLMMSHFQLCLAHYCDVHGPTPLMVTEGLPVPCSTCYDEEPPEVPRPQTSSNTPSSTTVITEALRRINLQAAANRSFSASNSTQDAQTHRATLLRASGLPSNSSSHATTTVPAATSAIETPPESPLRASGDYSASGPAPPQRRDAARFRRTYDDYITSRLQNPCESCALTLPKQQPDTATPTPNPTCGDTPADGTSATSGAAPVPPLSSRRGSTISNTDLRTDSHGPTLRTRAPFARVYGPGAPGEADMATPPKSRDSSSDREGRVDHDGATASRSSTASSSCQVGGNHSACHMHFLDYTSTHQPSQPESFSFVRTSCLRAMSQETLPRPPTTGDAAMPNNPTSPTMVNIPQNAFAGITNQGQFVTTHSAGTAVAGGPIVFGDPVSGFTTGYVFRVTDIHARGNKRLYAFLALSTHRECQVMRTFSYVSAAFRELAQWIQALAEAEAERAAENKEVAPWMAGLDPNVIPSQQPVSAAGEGQNVAPGGVGGYLGGDRSRGPGGSSFLAGGSRRYGGGLGGMSGGVNLKARGLADLVGMPDFFIKLHAEFVRLLLELGVMLSS
ncbi:hypothetical protein MKZ38_007527 [Zalerion maritima]|uniref:UDENN FLCN/SMCR8-type domain-containing protein n=1 Tax=Zalerion maritima TaxID=339359 RepID=A0AAD5RHK6_9PEZI|nr:hypothetical protein MKZ38_007527 [Zalerion maritima]